jgi:hypothetical protein
MNTVPKAFLIRDSGKSKAAHIWTGSDTACRMWSTGGLKKRRGYSIWSHPDGHSICHMCSNAAKLPQADFQPRVIIDSGERHMKEMDRAAFEHLRSIMAG